VFQCEWSSVKNAPVRELAKGIRIRPLWEGENGARALVLEMDPESCFEELDHHDSGPEEVFVVSGIFNDGVRDYPAGTFIHAAKGSSHVSRSTTGCILFVFYPEG
jgi:anti-sigma factor ChrR (cupin superfamily)